MTETAGGAFLLAGEFLSISSLEHKRRRGGRTGASSLAGGVCESFERKYTRLELTIDSNLMLTGKPVVFKALSSYF